MHTAAILRIMQSCSGGLPEMAEAISAAVSDERKAALLEAHAYVASSGTAGIAAARIKALVNNVAPMPAGAAK